MASRKGNSIRFKMVSEAGSFSKGCEENIRQHSGTLVSDEEQDGVSSLSVADSVHVMRR
jgi:hypothetical protein